MDHLFDELARILATQMPRRKAFGLISGAFAAAALGTLGVQPVRASDNKGKNDDKGKNGGQSNGKNDKNDKNDTKNDHDDHNDNNHNDNHGNCDNHDHDHHDHDDHDHGHNNNHDTNAGGRSIRAATAWRTRSAVVLEPVAPNTATSPAAAAPANVSATTGRVPRQPAGTVQAAAHAAEPGQSVGSLHGLHDRDRCQARAC